MKIKKIIIILVLAVFAGLSFAAPITLIFRDTSQTTKNLILLEDPNYPNATPTTYPRFHVQIYKTTDSVINPLNTLGQPTGDDVMIINTGGSQTLSFGPTGTWIGNTPALSCPDSIAVQDPLIAYHSSSNKVYFRIFNSTTIATATKYIQATSLYTILSANATINYIPTYGWSAWQWIAPPTLNPAVPVYPLDAATGVGYNNQTLSWNAGTGLVPNGYKVYFGTDNPPTNIVNGTLQTATTYAAGNLMMNQLYYWKIIPVIDTLEAQNCPVWSFTTRGEINPEAAINPIPADASTINFVSFPASQDLSWSPSATGQIPTGYKLFWNGSTTAEDLGNVLTVTKSIPAAGAYTWQIVPYYVDPGTRTTRTGSPIPTRISSASNLRGDAVNCPTWTFTAAQVMFYDVNITSTPTDADIYVDGVDSGFNTPHVFSMSQGSSAVYTVQKTGYAFAPANFTVTNITANTSQNFTGTLLTFTVDITSTPADADIYVDGVDSGFNTPHQFVMNYGTSAVYTVQKTGYTFAPANFTVTNITANASQEFIGTLLTFTVDIASSPTDADIYVDGVDSGFNTPHQFVMNYGTSAVYTVQKTGYTFTPANFTVTNITSNQSQTFNGSILTFTVDITSSPADADIFVNGTDSGFNTPHQFSMDYGSNAVYTVQKAGYTFAPTEFAVTNITANTGQNFVGTLLTFTVDITASITGVSIYVDGVDSGFDAPHQFVMNYGTSAVYSPLLAGYIFTPPSFTVTNIQANTAQHFTGDWITVSVTPDSSEVTHEAGSVNLAIDCNSAWAVTEDVAWLSVAPMTGNNIGTITVTYEANPTTTARTGNFTVTAGLVTVTVAIHQLGIVGNDDEVNVLVPMLSVYPNPFSASTHLKVDVKSGSEGVLDIYSIKGQHVKSLGAFTKGSHTLVWNGKDDQGRTCSSGFYFARYRSPEFNKTVKILKLQQ